MKKVLVNCLNKFKYLKNYTCDMMIKNKTTTKPLKKIPKKPIPKKPKARTRLGRLAMIGLVTQLLLAPVRANHPGPAPNPAARANVNNNQVTAFTQQGPNRSGFYSYRYSHQTTTAGPVVFAELSNPARGKPTNNIRLGLAQNVKIPSETIMRLGLRTPNLNGKKIDLKNSDFGLILVRKGNSLEAQHTHGSGTRYTGSTRIQNSSVNVSHMEPGFFSQGRSNRIGVKELEKTLGINLGRISTDLGLTFPQGQSARVDAGIFIPTTIGGARGGIALNAFKTGSKETRGSALLVINF
jgi:hypothetical protein